MISRHDFYDFTITFSTRESGDQAFVGWEYGVLTMLYRVGKERLEVGRCLANEPPVIDGASRARRSAMMNITLVRLICCPMRCQADSSGVGHVSIEPGAANSAD